MFVVDDAEWSLKQRAQDCRRWLHGKLREASFDKLYPAIIRDASVRGDGVVYVDRTDDDILIERVHRRGCWSTRTRRGRAPGPCGRCTACAP